MSDTPTGAALDTPMPQVGTFRDRLDPAGHPGRQERTAMPESRIHTPEQGSRLADLMAAWPSAKAAADQAKEQLDQIRAQIKAEISDAGLVAEGGIPITLVGPVPLVASIRSSTRLDGTKLKQEYPEVWEFYARTSSSYDLREAK